MNPILLITLSGEDQPGVTAGLTDMLSAHGANILDIGQAVIHASLTLGLAPFVPEPHLVEKLRWIAGGAAGMRAIDWFDVVMHGAPWVLLAMKLVRVLKGGERTA